MSSPMPDDDALVNIPVSFTSMTLYVRSNNILHGFRNRDGSTNATFGDRIALLHSEASEALEAYRARGLESWDGPGGKPEGVASEFADVFIRLLDDCDLYGIDLEAEFFRKMEYNMGRPYKHGKAY